VSWKPRQRPAQRRREPARVAGKIGRVLGELGFDLEASLRVSRAFEEALGPELAPHFELVDCRGQTLEVKAGSPAWSQELAIRQVEVLARMAERLGPGAPTEIRLHVR
jgi:predicted nucleic acid-binding Zn ribbon protein